MQNLNKKKPALLPLELQIQIKREKRQQEMVAAEIKAKEMEVLAN